MAFRSQSKKVELRRSFPTGTFSQSMVVVRGNILLILAGYSGTMTNAVYAYTTPASLALNIVRDCDTARLDRRYAFHLQELGSMFTDSFRSVSFRPLDGVMSMGWWI